MISFIKKLFKQKAKPKPVAVFGKNSVILPNDAVLVKMPPVVISEPVHSFIACVKSNPGRFEVSLQYKHMSNFGHTTTYSIKDKKASKSYSLTKEDFYGGGYLWERDESISFLSREECEYLVDKISPIYNERSKLYRKILNQRKRRALTKIYGAQQ